MILFLRENWKALTIYLATVSAATVVVAYFSYSMLLSPAQVLYLHPGLDREAGVIR